MSVLMETTGTVVMVRETRNEKIQSIKEGFYDLAGKIEDSRIIRGALFLSDNLFAKLIVRKHIVPSTKE